MEKNKTLLANILLVASLLLFRYVPYFIMVFLNKIMKIPRSILINGDSVLILSGVTSVIVLGGIAFLYSVLTGRKFKKAMHIKRISGEQIKDCMLLGLGGYVFTIGVNLISMSLFPIVIEDGNRMGELLTGGSFFTGLIVVVLIPAIFEELFFRGIFVDAYDNMNKYVCCVIVSAIFALFHGNIMQIIYVMVLGSVLYWGRVLTGSIVGGMVIHATVNGISFGLSQISGFATKLLNEMGKDIALNSSQPSVGISEALITSIIFFVIGGVVIYAAVYGLKKSTCNTVLEDSDDIIEHGGGNLLENVEIREAKRRVSFSQYIPLLIYFVLIIYFVYESYI